MSIYKFSEHKEEISKAINEKISKGLLSISDPNGFTIYSFTNIYIQDALGDVPITLGGLSIPAVILIGNSSGIIYTFALKVLFPNIEV